MYFLGVLLVLVVVAALFVFPPWAYLTIKRLLERLAILESEVRDLKATVQRRDAAAKSAVPAAASPVSTVVPTAPAQSLPLATPAGAEKSAASPTTPSAPPKPAVPPELPPALPRDAAWMRPHAAAPAPRIPAPARLPEPEPAPVRKAPLIQWEQFMGVKLFAWLGGFAAFLGVAFGIKYSIEHALVPPEVRAAGGFLFALALIGGGLWLSRKRYLVTAQTLCATGVVSLYAITYACRNVYHFPPFTPLVTFGVMVAATALAFTLALRLEAQVVAILGILGGFLTPVLVSTGEDNPFGLFTYVALLNAGLFSVALKRGWRFLLPLGALGTAALQLGWAVSFLGRQNSDTALCIGLSMEALFVVFYVVARRFQSASPHHTASVALLAVLGSALAFYLSFDPPLALTPAKWLGFLLLVDLGVLVLAWFEEHCAQWPVVAGGVVFALLANWAHQQNAPNGLPWELGAYFVFAVLHSAYPLVLQRRHPAVPQGPWGELFSPLALSLILFPLVNATGVAFGIWPGILLIDLLAIAVCAYTASFLGVALALLLTLVTAGLWIFKLHEDAADAPALLAVIGFFAALFFAAGLWLAKRFSGDQRTGPDAKQSWQALPLGSVLLPFALAAMEAGRLRQPEPSAVFGLVLGLDLLALGLTVLLSLEWLPVCALAGTAAVALAWHDRNISYEHDSGTAIFWCLGFVGLFAGFAEVFRGRFLKFRGPWVASALSGAALFPPVYRLLTHDGIWPDGFKGGIPFLFALPPLVQCLLVRSREPAGAPGRLTRLALFGGAALFFLTLIFPIQFTHQYLTLGWALEGAALLWLFHKVPHPGLPKVGLGLLAVCFVRLVLNPEVLDYHAAGGMPFLNWYLAAYGLTALCCFAGARLLAPPRSQVFGYTVPPVLQTAGVILLFVLLNLEIADYFAPPGSQRLTFDFTGNFARDMSYTIGWAVFAFVLITVGLVRELPKARYAALALFGCAALKLFFHDLAHLGTLYLIGALFAVAVLAFLASMVYQRFLPDTRKTAAKD